MECHPTYQPPIATAERNEDLLPTIARYMELGEEIKALESERNFIKGHLQTAAAGGDVLAGDWRVRMATIRRESFDTKLARKELATDVLARFLKVSEVTSLKIEEVL